jgi:DNA-directed RNA polymerase specialized sigma24 family protein
MDIEDEQPLLADEEGRRAIALLYDRYRDRVLAFCRCLVPDREAAEDLTETAFSRLVECLPEIQRRDTPALPWLLLVAVNASRSQKRRLGVERRYVQRTSGQISTPVAVRDDADSVRRQYLH